MKEKRMKKIIDEYVKAFNKFDVEGMVKDLHENMEFKNITNGEVNVELNGKIAFKNQLEQGNNLFKKREMKITDQKFENNIVENKVDFKGVLAMDIPDGPKAGELIKIKNKSIFYFKNGKVISIEDIN